MGNTGGGGTDSLARRDKNEDSITIRFRYLDSTRNFFLDSSINDYTQRFPIPATNLYLGNTGSASRSFLFSPTMQSGWDAGMHSYDIYAWNLNKVRFFNTTRPYSELNYQLASRSEQIIELVHTQNVKPNWNLLGQYRMINAPGFFKNQKTNHNNYLLTSWYHSVNKRYNNYAVVLGNKLQAGENGGVIDTGAVSIFRDPDFKDRFDINTKLGGDPSYSANFFSTDVGTGNRYSTFTALMRQQYDFGRKDSLVTDSTIIPLFYPRLRVEHTIQYSSYKYNFLDKAGDSLYYQTYYDTAIGSAARADSFQVNDSWKELINDFSISTFPDANNLQQFFKVGAAIQNLTLENLYGKKSYYNIFGHAEYRNRTRNQQWDVQAYGKLYFVGLNAGDYTAMAMLQRFIGKRKGFIQLGFENVNRTPSFIYNAQSNFYLQKTNVSFKKENVTHLSASMFQPAIRLTLAGHYYLVTNYTYMTDYFQLGQQGSLFNMLQIAVNKTFKLGKNWFWHADVYFQQRIGNAPVNVPAIYTRNRIGYEGSLGFKNLDIAFGLEGRYHTAYKAYNYSPVLGQFFYQDSLTIKNPLPDIAGYMHFRIRSFKLYIRAENLNTAEIMPGGKFGFTHNNFAAPGYAYPGMILRFGIYWSFVN